MLTLCPFCLMSLFYSAPRVKTEANDILLLDFSADVDCNQNNIKGKASVTSCTLNHRTFSENYFPTPDSDPFRDDPLSKSPAQNISKFSMDSSDRVSNTLTDNVVNVDSELISKTVIIAKPNGHWPLSDKASDDSANTVMDGHFLETSSNPFFENSSKNSLVLSNMSPENTLCSKSQSQESVLLSPPPQNAKAGRRRSTKSTSSDLFGADLFGSGQPEGSSAAGELFNSAPANSDPSSLAALENLQLGPTATIASTVPGWGVPSTVAPILNMPGMMPPGPRPVYPQPSAFGGLPIPPSAWGAPMPQFVPPLSPPHLAWGPPAGAISPAAPGWGQPSTNPFHSGQFPAMGEQPGPARPPPRPPVKEPPKVENSAFTALDPLGEKEKKTGKDMFKDFKIAKPPAIPARKSEQASGPAPGPAGKEGGAFDQYFSSKVGVAQEAADHDDFDIHQMSASTNVSASTNGALAPSTAPAPSVSAGFLDAAFSPAPAANTPAQAQTLSHDMFDEAFGVSTSGPSIAPVVTASSGGLGDPFDNPFA